MCADKIAVIIPLKGEPPDLVRCLESVLSQEYLHKEIILIDDGAGPHAREVLGAYAGRIRVLDSSAAGPSQARNLAAASTDAAYLAFTDSDCIVSAHWLNALKGFLDKTPGAAGCAGAQLLPADASFFQRKVYRFLRLTMPMGEYLREGTRARVVSHNASCNVMYRREPFLTVGGFRPSLWPGEDVELDYRLRRRGYTLYFVPDAVVYHYRPKDPAAFIRMLFRYGWAQARLIRLHGFFRPLHYLPITTLLTVCAVAAVVSVGGVPLWIVTVCLMGGLLGYCRGDGIVALLCLVAILAWHAGFLKGMVGTV